MSVLERELTVVTNFETDKNLLIIKELNVQFPVIFYLATSLVFCFCLLIHILRKMSTETAKKLRLLEITKTFSTEARSFL